MSQYKLIIDDSGLKPFENHIIRRNEKALKKELELTHGKKNLFDVVNGHLFYGLHKYSDKWIIREWAPNAESIYLIGDFSNWKPQDEYKFKKIENQNWELEIPLQILNHRTIYKLLVCWNGGQGERIPSYCRSVVQDNKTLIFNAQVWEPENPYIWKNKNPKKVKYPLIYEAHIGMATKELRVGTYNEFCINVIPRIADLGYNMIQLMGIQEHPYYGSFGYQVSNFFAPSSRFGTPDELKHLIDLAHGFGISVILDIVHSHAVKNEIEGISKFDGTEYQYFHEGAKGEHPVWDSRCFNYGKNDVINFLLSNCKYWLDEYRFDGFRFDGVTSMMYFHHGLGIDFLNYDMYFDGNQDEEAIVYLILANKLIHQSNNNAITIAEDVSGMPGLAASQDEGGIGFDFRMSMGVADFWVKYLKEIKDEDWHVGDMFYHLTNKRNDECTISYAECHDQAMMGDKTIIFRLIGEKMYTKMNIFEKDIIVDRGIALHKIIRLATLSTAGDGYLNFMGNEFGHPEWIDFPRQGNNWSYQYARRQWNLVDDNNLKYKYLNELDQAIIILAKHENIFDFSPFAIVQNNSDQVLIFKRGDTVFAFNFNAAKSFPNYGFEIDAGKYIVILDSDARIFGGFNRNTSSEHFTIFENKKNQLKLYLPSRSALVLKKVD